MKIEFKSIQDFNKQFLKFLIIKFRNIVVIGLDNEFWVSHQRTGIKKIKCDFKIKGFCPTKETDNKLGVGGTYIKYNT